MRISRVDIKRFLGIQSLSIDVDKAFQIIAGPNNSGKTTFLKALKLFFCGLNGNIDAHMFAPKNEYYVDEGNRSKTNIKITFSDLSKHEFELFKGHVDSKNRLVIELGITRNGSAEYHFHGGKRDDVALERLMQCHDVIYVPITRTYENGANEIHAEKLGGLVKDILVKSRRGSHAYELWRSIRESLAEVRSIVEGVIDESRSSIEKILPEAASIRFNLPDDEEIIGHIAAGIDIKSRSLEGISLGDEGAGFQSIMSLGLINSISEKKRKNVNVILLVEEPEAFLHPHYQRNIVSFLTEISRKNQVVVTTHSHIVIDSVDIKCVARFKRMDEGLSQEIRGFVASENESSRLMRYLSRGNSELVFADKVVLCEGESDAALIRRMISSIRIDGVQNNISVIGMGSADLADIYKKICERFSIDSYVILDRDKLTPSNRAVVKKLCRLSGCELLQRDFDQIDQYNSVASNSARSAMMARKKINEFFNGRNIFFFSADLEYAVGGSIRKEILLPIMQRHGLLQKHQASGLDSLKDGDFVDQVSLVLHSKGRGLDSSSNGVKLKPHLAACIVADAGFRYVNGSDLQSLDREIRRFLTAQS